MAEEPRAQASDSKGGSEPEPQRKAYQRPRLRRLGTVRELTLGNGTSQVADSRRPTRVPIM